MSDHLTLELLQEFKQAAKEPLKSPRGGVYGYWLHSNTWRVAAAIGLWDVTIEQVEAGMKEPDGYIGSRGACDLFVALPLK